MPPGGRRFECCEDLRWGPKRARRKTGPFVWRQLSGIFWENVGRAGRDPLPLDTPEAGLHALYARAVSRFDGRMVAEKPLPAG